MRFWGFKSWVGLEGLEGLLQVFEGVPGLHGFRKKGYRRLAGHWTPCSRSLCSPCPWRRRLWDEPSPGQRTSSPRWYAASPEGMPGSPRGRQASSTKHTAPHTASELPLTRPFGDTEENRKIYDEAGSYLLSLEVIVLGKFGVLPALTLTNNLRGLRSSNHDFIEGPGIRETKRRGTEIWWWSIACGILCGVYATGAAPIPGSLKSYENTACQGFSAPRALVAPKSRRGYAYVPAAEYTRAIGSRTCTTVSRARPRHHLGTGENS